MKQLEQLVSLTGCTVTDGLRYLNNFEMCKIAYLNNDKENLKLYIKAYMESSNVVYQGVKK